MFRKTPRSILNALSLGAVAISAFPIAGARADGKSVHATGNEIKISKASASEQYERDVDQVALASQEQAIAKLNTLLKKYRGRSQEPVLLAKLAELQSQNASIDFRIAHGNAHRRNKAPDLARYNRTMAQTIATLSTLIAKYPSFEEIPHAYFMRGKSYEDLGKKEAATRDYLHLVDRYPEAEDTSAAYMSLADFRIEENDHPKAIAYLKHVEQRPDDPHYPFALYKLAWSYYNLKDVSSALSYAERQIAYYADRNKGQTAQAAADLSPSSDLALRENTLLDTAVFYFEGYEQGASRYRLSDALSYFKRLDNGPILGRMLLRFAKLLRSHDHEEDLISWKDQILLAESSRPESLDAVLTVYEYQLNKRRYGPMIETAKDVVKLHKTHPQFESFEQARKLLLDTADGLQTVIVKNKAADGVQALSSTLAVIYDAFTQIVDEKDPRIPRVHYNLAETLFTIRDYQGATDHYRWVVDHGDSGRWETVADASLKAIAAKYEILTQKQLIPRELAAKPLRADQPDKSLPPELVQWIAWVDTHLKHYDPKKVAAKDREQEKSELNFLFEADRALYSQLHLHEAIDRFQKYIRAFPSSPYTEPSASIVLDTYLAGSQWVETHELAQKFLGYPQWKQGAYHDHLYVVASDSYYKRIEGAHRDKNYVETLKLADDFLKLYGDSARKADTLSLAGGAALATQDRPRAYQYFTRLIKESPKSQSVAQAFVARSEIAEGEYDFTGAAEDLRAFLSLPADVSHLDGKKSDELRKKTLTLFWLAGDVADLKAALDSKTLCTEALAGECDKYQALLTLSTPEKSHNEDVTADAFEKCRKTTGEPRALWAAVALENPKSLAFRDRLLAIRHLSTSWDDLDPLVKFAIAPYISLSVPKAFQINRMSMGEVAPLRADEKYITHRVDMIREMENGAAKALKLPWARVRAEVMNETAGLYLDLARGLNTIPAPKSLSDAELAAYQQTIQRLTMPFEEKGQEIRGKAFEIASTFSIEDESLERIADPYFAENPSLAKSLKSSINSQLQAVMKLDVAWLEKVEHAQSSAFKPTAAALLLRKHWGTALKRGNWQQVAFFIQKANQKSQLDAAWLGAVKAVSFASIGAKAEGIAELEESHEKLAPEAQKLAVNVLMGNYNKSYARNKTQALLREILRLDAPSEKSSGSERMPASKKS